MARLYGASTADFTFDGDVVVGGVALAVSTSPSPAGRVTSGLTSLDGTVVNRVTSDADGEIRFLGDDALPLDLWLATLDDLGNYGAKWYVVRAANLGGAVTSAAATAQDAASAAQAAATQAGAAGVAAVTAARGQANGVAPLDANGLVPVANLPAAASGANALGSFNNPVTDPSAARPTGLTRVVWESVTTPTNWVDGDFLINPGAS